MAHTPHIRPVSDLRNKFSDISRLVHESGQPVYLTKNGHGDMVVMSLEAYEQDLFEREIYLKLKEAELEAAAGAARVPHGNLMGELRALAGG